MKQKWKMNTVEKFEGDWVRIREVMINSKNLQMWNFGLEEMKLGIRASMKEYAEWYHGRYGEISRKKEP